jgi:hypothetical protein
LAKEGESTFQRFFPSLSLLLFASDNGFPLPLTSLNAARAYRSRVRQPSFTGFDDGAGDAWSDGDDDLLDAAAITKGTITPPPSATFAPSSTSADANDSAPLPPQQQQQQQQQQQRVGLPKAYPAPKVAPTPETSANDAQAAPLPPATSASLSAPAGDVSSATSSGAESRRGPRGPGRAEPLIKSKEELRLEKFEKLLTSPSLNLAALRELSWSGVPPSVRPTVWRLLAVRFGCGRTLHFS